MTVKVKETQKPVKKKKEFHAVEMMREIRNKIDKETEGMNYEELRAYIDAKLGNRTNG